MIEDANQKVIVVMLLSNAYNPDDRVRNEALALRDSGYRVVILAWDRDCKFPEMERLDDIEIHRIQIPSGYEQGLKQGQSFFKVWRWFVQEIRKIRPQIVHCHDFDTFPAGIWYQSFHGSVKLIFDAHESYYSMMKPTISKLFAWVISVLERIFTWRAHLLISPCQATANYYIKKGAKNAIVVGNWKKPEDYKFDVKLIEQKRIALGIGDRLVITYIGNLSAERNVLPLLDMLKDRPDVFLILGGRGNQDDQIRVACSCLDNIYFPGYISPVEVPFFTALADVIYYGHSPSHGYARFNAPNKLYEALAAGKAILASDIGGELSSVVRATQCGILLQKVDAVTIGSALDVLAQDSVRTMMQERAAKAGLTTYNWMNASQKLTSSYAQLVGK